MLFKRHCQSLGFTDCRFWERQCRPQWCALLRPANNGRLTGCRFKCWCHVLKPWTQFCTFRLLETYRSSPEEFCLTHILPKSSFNTTPPPTHTHTHARWKHRKQLKISNGLLFPTHHKAHIGLPQIYTSLKPWEMPSVEKDLGVKNYRCGCAYEIQSGTIMG